MLSYPACNLLVSDSLPMCQAFGNLLFTHPTWPHNRYCAVPRSLTTWQGGLKHVWA